MANNKPLEERLFAALQRLTELSQENCSLRAENVALRSRLNMAVHGSRESSATADQGLDEQLRSAFDAPSTTLSKAEKVAIFRALFRGRQDTYPLRWENSRTGKAGYSPAIENKWEYLEAKRGRSPGVEPRYLPVTDEVIQHHLEGRIIAGVYPLLNDDTCWFLAVDFDESS